MKSNTISNRIKTLLFKARLILFLFILQLSCSKEKLNNTSHIGDPAFLSLQGLKCVFGQDSVFCPMNSSTPTGTSTGSGTGTGTNTGTTTVNPPSNLSYSVTSIEYVNGTIISPLTPTVTGTITGCSINPALPTGLSLNSTTCSISGTASSNSALTTYTVTASNSGGNTTASVSIAITAAGTKQWTKQMGVAALQTHGRAVAGDASGNVYVAGKTTGGLDGNTLTGTDDLFLTKFNSAGTKQWTKQIGVSFTTDPAGVATDSSGNIYITGYTDGNLDGVTITGNQDVFLVKYNSFGTKQWTKLLGVAATFTNGLGVCSDSSGYVYITGTTYGNLDGNTLTGSNDMFVTKYDTNGTKLWTRQLGVVGNTYGRSIAADSSGNIFVAGETTGGLDGNTLTGSVDYFVTKYNSSGVKQWTKQNGPAGGSAYGQGIGLDPNGNIFVFGNTSQGMDGNTQTGFQDFFVAKYNSSGTKQWVKQLGVAGNTTNGLSGTVDTFGNAYVGGYTTGGLDGNTISGTMDFFLTKYDTSGTKLWTRQLGIAGFAANGRSVAQDSFGNLLISGFTTGGLDGNTVVGNPDFFVTKYQ